MMKHILLKVAKYSAFVALKKIHFSMEALTKKKLLLNPLDRASEILFGIIMALTFTCSIGVASRGPAEIRELLIAAISCNLAWGIVDATMYLIGVLAQKSRSKAVLDAIYNS